MKTNESYSLVIELYNRDYETWQRQQTYVNGTGMWVENNSTTKYQYSYGSSNTLLHKNFDKIQENFIFSTNICLLHCAF